jgi:hypothetical protein
MAPGRPVADAFLTGVCCFHLGLAVVLRQQGAGGVAQRDLARQRRIGGEGERGRAVAGRLRRGH